MRTRSQTTTQEVREAFVQSYRWMDGSPKRGARKSALRAFALWLDAYTAKVRSQVADEIEADLVRLPDGSLDTFNQGQQYAATIARAPKEKSRSKE